MKTPITYYGGKQNLTSELIPLIPEHYQYCEVFVGGGALLFAKPKSKHEAINDIDNRLIIFWEVLQNNFDDFYKMLLSKRLHSEKYFNDAKFILNNQNSLLYLSVFMILFFIFSHLHIDDEWNYDSFPYELSLYIHLPFDTVCIHSHQIRLF